MSENQQGLGHEDAQRLLGKLGEILARKQQQLVPYVMGDANIALAIGDTRITKSIDAVIKAGRQYLQAAAAEVASTEPGLAPDWISTEFTGDTYDGGMTWSWFDNKKQNTPIRREYGKGLEVQLASPEVILMLKTLARRPKGIEDIAKLMRLTGTRTPLDLGKNLYRFTGRRIFDAQIDPMMYLHTDPEFREIPNRFPPDLQPAKPPKNTLRDRIKRLFNKKTR